MEKKTIDVFQERLDLARQAQQGAEITEEPDNNHFPTNELQRGRSKPTKKDVRSLADTKSAGNILMGNYSFPIKDYSNLQVLLEGENDADSFADIFKNSSKPQTHKYQQHNSFQSTSSSFFSGKKNRSEISFHTRPITTNTQSNFVFRKKRADFVNKFQVESLYNYGLEKVGFTIPEDTFGLNGRKMAMKEVTTDAVVRQQKKYLKELKLDPLTIFRSKLPTNDESPQSPEKLSRESASPSYKKPYLITKCNQRSIKKNLQKTQQSFHVYPKEREIKPESTRSNNMFTLDGSQVKPSESPINTPKKPSKGFSQYVHTSE